MSDPIPFAGSPLHRAGGFTILRRGRGGGAERRSPRGAIIASAVKGGSMSDPIPFAGSPLDRAGNLRRDPAWLAERLAAPDSRFLPFWRLNVLAHESEPGLVWLDGRVRDGLSEASPVVLLGLRDSVAHFGVDISSLEDPVAPLGLEDARFAEVRSVAARAPAGEAGIMAQARALLYWHERHRFCSACGAPTSLREAGYMRKCDACGAEHFPRTDPAVIMVAWRGDRCILGRQKVWAPGFYSPLPRFLPPRSPPPPPPPAPPPPRS